jgi:hypothetical protein
MKIIKWLIKFLGLFFVNLYVASLFIKMIKLSQIQIPDINECINWVVLGLSIFSAFCISFSDSIFKAAKRTLAVYAIPLAVYYGGRFIIFLINWAINTTNIIDVQISQLALPLMIGYCVLTMIYMMFANLIFFSEEVDDDGDFY